MFGLPTPGNLTACGLKLGHQLGPHPFDEPDHEGVAHHERASTLRHAGVGPVVRKAVQSLQLAGRQATEATVLDLDEVLEAGRRAAALARQDCPALANRYGRDRGSAPRRRSTAFLCPCDSAALAWRP